MVDRWGYVEIPARTTFGAGGGFDVVIHFHGGGLDGRAKKAKLDAVLVSSTLGDGSSHYRELFSQGYTLSKAMAAIERRVQRQSGVEDAHIQRLALSSFSAGYGAIGAILRDPHNDNYIDAVLMADGLHVDLKNNRGKHHRDKRPLDAAAMQPYLRFARAAVQGDKLFLLTHSQIPTGTFASTRETAAYLIRQLNLPVRHSCKHNRHLMLLSCHGRGNMLIAGYYGTHEEDHMAHAYSQHSTMYRTLHKRWRR